ncbi:MAG: DUF885 domain-containing protein [Alteromonadaceae bacterium]|nr:MAG: DUF885 domain-containing protein [Alteromonadaceae bacterium]
MRRFSFPQGLNLTLSLVLGIAFSLFACQSDHIEENEAQLQSQSQPIGSDAADAVKRANVLFDVLFEEAVARSPITQAWLGRKTNNDQWDDHTESFAAQSHELTKLRLGRLQALDITLFDSNTHLSYQLMQADLERSLTDYRWRYYNYPINQMWGEHTEPLSILMGQHPIESIADARAYIARLSALPASFDQIIDALKIREQHGISLPKFIYPDVITTLENIMQGAPFKQGEKDSDLFADIKQKLHNLAGDDQAVMSAELHQQLLIDAEDALVTSVLPAYQGLLAYLILHEKTADKHAGVWKFPDGDEFYAYALKQTTTTDLTADEIHNIGLQEVKRIHKEMVVIKSQVKFDGSLKEFMVFMRDDERFYYPDTAEGREQYLAKARGLIEGMENRLDQLFNVKPKTQLEVKAVEAYRERAAGKAFYNPPAEDGSRPGYYYANLYDMRQMPIYQMEALAYHEGIPGHHMQIAIALELQNIPKFRRNGHYTAYTEGWGLYAEYIPKEVGLYSDPYSDFGRLSMELWRACRLVVDTGIHALRWDREKSIAFYRDNTPNPERDIVKMVERHVVMPGQATAYKVGMLKILQLRKQAREALVGDFDIREFHDVVLKHGAVPLYVLESLVEKWIEAKLAESND